MVKVEKISGKEALDKLAASKRPHRWDEVFRLVRSSDSPIIVPGLTRGSTWHFSNFIEVQGLVSF